MSRILLVTAVPAERDAISSASADVTVAVGGVGPAEAAATTSALLARERFDLVLSVGVAGGFAPATVGSVVVADQLVFADLGAETADGFRPVSALGFGTDRLTVQPDLARELAQRTAGRMGPILTVATVTGTADTTAELLRRHAHAVAEAMEGFGVAIAARHHDVPFGEVRAISNIVGPRDRDAWDIPAALDALRDAVHAITKSPWSLSG